MNLIYTDSHLQVTIGLHKRVLGQVLGHLEQAMEEAGVAANVITSWHGDTRSVSWGGGPKVLDLVGGGISRS